MYGRAQPLTAPSRPPKWSSMMAKTIEERFWPKVQKTEDCWLWTAATARGYGKFSFGTLANPSRMVHAHRFSYELLVGPIPDGLELDHLCRVKLCVNPAHLEPVTHQENTRRAPSNSAALLARTHCVNGHLWDAANTRTQRGWRLCRACGRERSRRHRAKRYSQTTHA